MQVRSLEPGHAVCAGRGQLRRVRTALVGPVDVGQWLLIFIDSAQECISAQRAQEINATLDMMEAVLSRDSDTAMSQDLSFALPSAMSLADVRAMAGDHGPSDLTPPGTT